MPLLLYLHTLAEILNELCNDLPLSKNILWGIFVKNLFLNCQGTDVSLWYGRVGNMTKDVAISRKRKLRLSAAKSFLLLGMSPRTSHNGFISLPPAGNISMDIKLPMGSEHSSIITDKTKCFLNLKDITSGFQSKMCS